MLEIDNLDVFSFERVAIPTVTATAGASSPDKSEENMKTLDSGV